MTASTPKTVALAAGGTGGHMFPAQALARTLLSRGFDVCLFTDRRGGGLGPDLPQVRTYAIASGGIAGIGAVRRIRNTLRIGLGYLQARAGLRACGASCIVGFGGYASVPPVLAGAHLGLRVVLHEQNAVFGRANRRLARYADVVCTSFDAVAATPESAVGKLVLTGNPVRPDIAEIGRRPYGLPGTDGALTLLVTGGSQGATVFNDLVPEALSRLPEEIRRRLTVYQQAPGDGVERVAEAYRQAGIKHELAPFFVDLPRHLAAAQLVICRAGASTLAELACAGRPAILVPFPAATDDHQTANAKSLCEAGGGWLMPQATLTAESLAGRLEDLLSAPATLAEAAHAALKAAKRDAQIRLADAACGTQQPNGDDRREEQAA
jgi:UDP-N-acetylglucosamine--N-acetylmuramyl-(pentapeptide) pyrophosphoryl-undecaprenol N-acetylglucosamine transferase